MKGEGWCWGDRWGRLPGLGGRKDRIRSSAGQTGAQGGDGPAAPLPLISAPPPHLRPSFAWQLRVWGQLKTSQSFLITCNGKRPFVSGFL